MTISASRRRFERQVAFLAEHPEYGVVGSWSEDIDIEGRPIFVTGTDHPLTHEDVLHNHRRPAGRCCAIHR